MGAELLPSLWLHWEFGIQWREKQPCKRGGEEEGELQLRKVFSYINCSRSSHCYTNFLPETGNDLKLAVANC